jgi:hypothetical protein
MTKEVRQEVTALLARWRAGSTDDEERLVMAVRSDHTRQPTALVNEAYLRLVGNRDRAWKNRAHVFGVAARVVRRILVDHARKVNAVKLPCSG